MARSIATVLIVILIASTGCADPQREPSGDIVEPDVATQEVTYSAGGVTMNGYVAWDSNIEGRRPGVLVVHEWWGQNDYARKRARMLAELGYTALAVDMYGDGKTAEHPDDAGKFATEVASNMDAAAARFDAALALLKGRESTDPERIAAIGYCFGGSVVLEMARRGVDLDGVASFHGGLGTASPAQPDSVKAKILVLTGGADPLAPADQVEAFRQEMDNAAADYEVVVYDGAMHSFTNPAADSVGAKFEMPLRYDAEADQQSWTKLQDFFASIFG